ncbi:hypothetical protein N7E70_009435 [Aminobacter sp. NyZ550]|uniref:hypothetical protein n=1 Tax=Aminobacter sp. NyZ550 TaxID=2979870 RepID=UPI0021D5D771|nr:hypothetical protein [Aminobacter sp. NyZ550]WAX97040.1 hypothetical protein N7E70_009435 [Aminobacter sp. NyZ550]
MRWCRRFRTGVATACPHSPQGWRLQAAYRKVVDRIRQNKSEARKVDDLKPLVRGETAEDPDVTSTNACV